MGVCPQSENKILVSLRSHDRKIITDIFWKTSEKQIPSFSLTSFGVTISEAQELCFINHICILLIILQNGGLGKGYVVPV